MRENRGSSAPERVDSISDRSYRGSLNLGGEESKMAHYDLAGLPYFKDQSRQARTTVRQHRKNAAPEAVVALPPNYGKSDRER